MARLDKVHWWNSSKAFRQGSTWWLPAKCGTGIAVSDQSAKALAKVTCIRCAKMLGVKQSNEVASETKTPKL